MTIFKTLAGALALALLTAGPAAAQTVLACFGLALVWWITEPFPPYLTSLILLVLLVFRDVQPMDKVLGVLGNGAQMLRVEVDKNAPKYPGTMQMYDTISSKITPLN